MGRRRAAGIGGDGMRTGSASSRLLCCQEPTPPALAHPRAGNGLATRERRSHPLSLRGGKASLCAKACARLATPCASGAQPRPATGPRARTEVDKYGHGAIVDDDACVFRGAGGDIGEGPCGLEEERCVVICQRHTTPDGDSSVGIRERPRSSVLDSSSVLDISRTLCAPSGGRGCRAVAAGLIMRAREEIGCM